MKTIDALLNDLFDGRPHALRLVLQRWFGSSRHYVAFVDINRDKIRKKIRLAQDAGAIEDLKWELEVAYLLHGDKRFSVSYEAYSRAQPFGPDFRVSYTTSFAFNVEVTRVRVIKDDDGARRLAETTGNKLRQVMPDMPNVIAIGVPAFTTDEAGYAAAMANLRASAEKRDPSVLSRLGFDTTPAFIKAFERLSAVVIRSTDDSQAFLWRNSAARSPLPAKAVTALRNCFFVNT